MRAGATTLGGEAREFPPTSWTLVLGARGAEDGTARACLDRLIGLYWKPVYWYIRRWWHRGNEDAKDMTQEFFCRLVEGENLLGFRAEGTRFRSFLRATLDHFLCNRNRAASRLRRGGDLTHVPIEALSEQGIELDAKGLDAGQAFDRAWALGLLADCLLAIEQAYRSSGRGEYFDLFARHDLVEGSGPTYAASAATFGISQHDVQNRLRHVRRSLRRLLRERVRETVLHDGEVDDELHLLFGGGSGR